jgi:hypothetical protein
MAPPLRPGGISTDGHFINAQVVDESRVGFLLGNGQDLVNLLEGRRHSILNEAHEGLDRGQARVACAGSVASFGLEVQQEGQDQGRVDLFKAQL